LNPGAAAEGILFLKKPPERRHIHPQRPLDAAQDREDIV
jgi:hypothetical protein